MALEVVQLGHLSRQYFKRLRYTRHEAETKLMKIEGESFYLFIQVSPAISQRFDFRSDRLGHYVQGDQFTAHRFDPQYTGFGAILHVIFQILRYEKGRKMSTFTNTAPIFEIRTSSSSDISSASAANVVERINFFSSLSCQSHSCAVNTVTKGKHKVFFLSLRRTTSSILTNL